MFPSGILGLYTLIILISSLYPVAYLLRNPAAPKPLLIFSTVYFLMVGLLLWARRPVAATLFLVGLLGLCGWTVWRLFSQGFVFTRFAMLAAWLVALPSVLVLRDEIRKDRY